MPQARCTNKRKCGDGNKIQVGKKRLCEASKRSDLDKELDF